MLPQKARVTFMKLSNNQPGETPALNKKDMGKYILTKTIKGKKYLYEVKDDNGNVVSKRTSTRNYVACSVNGEFYFGRLDLVGKGDYGKRLAGATKWANYTTSVYMQDRDMALKDARRCIAIEKRIGQSPEWLDKYKEDFYKSIDERFPTDPEAMEKKVSQIIEYGERMLKGLEIAYLK